MNFALIGMTLGLTAGLKPGPLGVFIIHQTLSKGGKHGFLASLSPWITDGPIILLSLLITVGLKDLTWFLSAVSVAGAIYLTYLAVKIFRSPAEINPAGKGGAGSSLLQAVKVNLLNPTPYIFWLTIGSGYISKGNRSEALLFVFSAIFTLSLTKFVVAMALRLLGERFNSKIYAAIMRALGFPLIIFSGQLLYSGITIWFN